MADEITESSLRIDETEHGYYVLRGDAHEWVWKPGHGPFAEEPKPKKAAKKGDE